MRFDATIFVEGISDERFISQFVKARFNFDLAPNLIQTVEGKTSLHLYTERFQISSDQGLKNLVVFDANGSFKTSLEDLERQKKELKIDFDCFLIPNHSDNGDLELLLEKITTRENKFILTCFNDYLTCLERSSNKNLNLPARKTKIYAYLELLRAPTKLNERNYLDGALWDLKSNELDSLAKFLKKHFVD